MNALSRKLKIFFLPFLIIAVAFVAGYTFLHWLLFIKQQVFAVREDILNFWMPFILPWIPCYMLLYPKFNLLRDTTRNQNLPFILLFVATLAMAVPTIVAQRYMESASGKLTALDTIGEIDQHDATKFYTIKNFYIDKLHVGVESTADVSGKYNNNFNMHLYVVMPIREAVGDTASATCHAWLGKEFSKTVSNSLSDEEKQQAFKTFARDSQLEFDKTDFSRFVYVSRVANNDDGAGFKDAVKKSQSVKSAKEDNIFLAQTEMFEERASGSFPWIFISFAIGSTVWTLIIFFVNFKQEEEVVAEKIIAEQEEKNGTLTSFFALRQGYIVTPIIISINLLVFAAMVFSGLGFVSFKTVDLLQWGANFRPYTTDGQWWRLLTSMFLHGGILHVAVNMYSLFFIGIFLEPLLGKWKYLIAYVLTGLLASAASIWWYEATPSVGASGAIFGLYGLFLALLVSKVFSPEFSKTFLGSTVFFVGFNLVLGLTGGIDNAAHIGGLVSGFLMGIALSSPIKRKLRDSYPDENSLSDGSADSPSSYS